MQVSVVVKVNAAPTLPSQEQEECEHAGMSGLHFAFCSTLDLPNPETRQKRVCKKVQQSAEHRGGSYLMFFFYDNQMISSQFLLSSELTLSQTLLYQHLSSPNKDNMK